MIPVFDKTAPYIWAAYGISVLVLILLTAGVVYVAGRSKTNFAKLESMDEEQST